MRDKQGVRRHGFPKLGPCVEREEASLDAALCIEPSQGNNNTLVVHADDLEYRRTL